MHVRHYAWFVGAALVLGDVAAAAAAADIDVPPRTDAGQTLAVPGAQADAGEVYFVTPGEDTQLICTSDALLQRTVVTCNRVVGYFVAPFDLDPNQPPLLAGALRIPAASCTTGVQQYDKLLAGKPLLAAGEFPEITARLAGVTATERTAAEKKRTTYKVKLQVQISAKGKALDLELPAQVEFIPFTWRTMGRNVGELLIVRAKLELKLADLGLEKPGPEFADRVADSVSVDLFLLCNTVSPDKSLDPKFKRDEYTKYLRFLTLIRDLQDADGGYEFGRTFVRDAWDSPAGVAGRGASGSRRGSAGAAGLRICAAGRAARERADQIRRSGAAPDASSS